MLRSSLRALTALIVWSMLVAAVSSGPVAAQVKYVYTVDYPIGKKADYLAWVKTNAETLQAPPEIKSIASYDNYFGATPHRFIEFEFESVEQAGLYYERPEVKTVLGQVVDHGLNAKVNAYHRRSDYTAGSGRGQIKMLGMINYPLGQKAVYLEWVRSVVSKLQAGEEVRRITSYDNLFAAQPHRLIEWEFDSIADAHKYFARPEVREVFLNTVNHGHAAGSGLTILELRGDYSK